MLGVEEDLDRRIQLATVAFHSLEKLLKNRKLVTRRVRLMSYRAIVESVLLYNCGTWALTVAQAYRLDCCQRRLLRRVIGLRWFHKKTNIELYKMCCISPASFQALYARWRLFGHTLRMDPDTPARQAMAYYFVKDHPGRPGKTTTIATVLSDDYEDLTGWTITTQDDYTKLVEKAADRAAWRELVADIVDRQYELYLDKEQKAELKRNDRKGLAIHAIDTPV